MSATAVDTYPMSAIPVLKRRIEWVCPNGCGVVSVTERADVHTQMHTCARLFGLMAPLIDSREKAKTVAVEREDYISGEQVQVDERGRPMMAVVTTRDRGEDRLVFAPLANMEVGA